MKCLNPSEPCEFSETGKTTETKLKLKKIMYEQSFYYLVYSIYLIQYFEKKRKLSEIEFGKLDWQEHSWDMC